MNLSMVFLVLILFIGYLLYDMFKKSQQQQELAQAQSTAKTSQSRLKPTYQNQCSILHQMHQHKMDTIKHKNVSVHLEEDNVISEFSESNRNHLVSIVKTLVKTHNVYLLVCRRKMVRNQLIEALRSAGVSQLGFQTTEGAVAVLRQLSCGTHLQGNLGLCNILVQYLPAIWFANPTKNEGTHHFKNQLDMMLNLEWSLKKGKEIKEE